ncbi:hypothetical protein [Janthinobacterium agaricidamnosum]|uniref:hypothetical protein n=1 Tax=Janthinobacterium agaricidamnosum TaxID=55508 RepID=UPI001184F5FC|nr:hypothetical protein [Janthinobacterium agaricidamnosum]
MANAESSAAVAAIKLVEAALQSGAIKLHGVTVNHTNNASAYGKADAAYLDSLIATLTAGIKAVD